MPRPQLDQNGVSTLGAEGSDAPDSTGVDKSKALETEPESAANLMKQDQQTTGGMATLITDQTIKPFSVGKDIKNKMELDDEEVEEDEDNKRPHLCDIV